MSLGPSVPRGVDLLVFSPHLDDAACSCGGRIAAAVRAGARVVVVTPFAGSPAAEGRRAGGTLSPFASMSSRREEDRRAMDRLGVVPLWMDIEEAIGRSPRYRSFLALFGRIRRSDTALLVELQADLERLCRASPGAELVFPLGVGGHVDHRILFEVSRRMMRAPAVAGRVSYFEEIPYSFVPSMVEHRLAQVKARVASPNLPADLAARESILRVSRRALEGILTVPVIRDSVRPPQDAILRVLLMARIAGQRARGGSGRSSRGGVLELRPDPVDVTDCASVKAQAIACYGSQLPALFGDAAAWRRAALTYSSLLGAGPGRLIERYWRPAT
ncbi:MAG TPA: PIG-L family deacetylase [Spirochaetia bacterium]|nr:PIG-L family deacetylase [Spirochaetia bacterium]